MKKKNSTEKKMQVVKGFEWSGWVKANNSVVTGYHCFGFNFGKPKIYEWLIDKNGKMLTKKTLAYEFREDKHKSLDKQSSNKNRKRKTA